MPGPRRASLRCGPILRCARNGVPFSKVIGPAAIPLASAPESPMPKSPAPATKQPAPRGVAGAANAKLGSKPKTLRTAQPQLSEVQLRRLPASERIRWRLVNAGQRHHANDNISAFLRDGELAELKAEVQAKMQEVLQALVIDTVSDHNTNDTARRVAKMYVDEVFGGRYRAAPAVTEFPNAARLNELLIVGPITVRSACSHHLCPIMGKVWIGVMPKQGSNLIGLSKYARMTEWVMSRPQIQEEAVVMLANELESRMKPEGLAIVMEADHFCMHWRGVKDNQSAMVNSVMRGAFLKDGHLRREFLSLLPRKAA